MKYKNLIFDFDGVLVESNEIRFEGFRQLFSEYPKNQVDDLINYVKANGGVSRYEKIRYFFEIIRDETIDDIGVIDWAERFSQIVKQKVIEAKPVKGSLEFLKQCQSEFDLAIVSGSDQEELRDICRYRFLDMFFLEILGSPTLKKDNIEILMSKFGWIKEESIYIGDSLNDLEAAIVNKIDFMGRSSGLVDWSQLDVKSVPNLLNLRSMLA